MQKQKRKATLVVAALFAGFIVVSQPTKAHANMITGFVSWLWNGGTPSEENPTVWAGIGGNLAAGIKLMLGH